MTRRLRWLLTASPSPYDNVIAAPERVLQDFIEAEIGDGRHPGWAAFAVDPASLAHRTGYFAAGFPNDGDGCCGWTDGSALKGLFRNGSD